MPWQGAVPAIATLEITTFYASQVIEASGVRARREGRMEKMHTFVLQYKKDGKLLPHLILLWQQWHVITDIYVTTPWSLTIYLHTALPFLLALIPLHFSKLTALHR